MAAAFRRLKAKGIGGAFVWALDNSCACGYQTEAALLAIASEPAAVVVPAGAAGSAPLHHHPPQQCCCVT